MQTKSGKIYFFVIYLVRGNVTGNSASSRLVQIVKFDYTHKRFWNNDAQPYPFFLDHGSHAVR